ncbi:chemotaxis protein, partial [Sphingosinicella sp. GR2756]|nr:chemotaxis protein [Sphingosinicella sp. GR2756]
MTATGQNRISLDERISLFDDGRLAENCREIGALLADELTRVAQRYWMQIKSAARGGSGEADKSLQDLVKLTLPYLAAKYGDVRGQRWVDLIGEHVQGAADRNISLTTTISAIGAAVAETHSILGQKLGNDPERLDRLARCLTQMTLLEVDLYAAHFDLLRARTESLERTARGTQFNGEIVNVAERTSADSKKLRAQAADASSAARGMLGKTAEVAAAAEQSALAMREATQTVAGLIRAIEDARSEVEVAADVAVRAGEQASQAVVVSNVLSDHVQAIESILGLIRDIAGQTNLLALNA